MEHVAAIMILGGAAADGCSEQAAPVYAFETVEACEEMLRPSINGIRRRFATAYGKCAAMDPAFDLEDATVTWSLNSANELDVKIRFDVIRNQAKENPMNRDMIEGKWKEYRGKAQTQWGKLTDDDLDVINGQRKELAGRIQVRYGVAKEEAGRQIDDWSSRH